ncbi:type II CAAX prenyl endopeptidase Rce1 family protein [Candidatus Enterococcus clewellii]|uniref:CAAX prenyl protease 2/Lysostaphin resistance protein A-like domain-containing protein n=1 Tax=Candidatus Enterococcus clewellii TaxID=1834193 RepID=A0A242K932_9ENTE|nr:hypothetical protein A5888_001822 [Enterococcus sp. 9E7_DIV0242]
MSEIGKRIVGYSSIILGFIWLSLGGGGAISSLGLFLGCLIGTPFILGKEGTLQLFKRPKHLFLWAIGMYIVDTIWGLVIGITLKSVGVIMKGNEVGNNLGWLFYLLIPFMLMAEEMMSLTLLEDFAKKVPLWAASVISAVIFGLMHFWTYNSGHFGFTLIHILTIQGVGRIFLNIAYLKGGRSIWTSWLDHMLIDLMATIIPLILTTLI